MMHIKDVYDIITVPWPEGTIVCVDHRLSVCLSVCMYVCMYVILSEVVSGLKLKLKLMDLYKSWYMGNLGDNIEWD